MGTIVVGVDGSDTAQAACREAAGLAEALGSVLHLVCAVDPTPAVEVGVGSDKVIVDGTSEGALILQQTKSALPSNLKVTTGVVPGSPAKALVEEAERVDADMIVVGNKRMQGVKRVLGSVANDVSHSAPCSVYIARTT